LVYYPRIVAWFNDTEHELFRIIGYPIEQMIRNDRTTFVMGEIHFRFIGPAAYGDRIVTTITLAEIGEHTLHWNCKAKNALTGAAVSEGRATRVYARIMEDGTLKAHPIPEEMLKALREVGDLKHLRANSATRMPGEPCGRSSVEDLARPGEHRRRDDDADGPRRLGIDHELELRRLLEREVGGPRALENPVCELGRTAPQLDLVRPVTQQGGGGLRVRAIQHAGDAVLRCRLDDLRTMLQRQAIADQK